MVEPRIDNEWWGYPHNEKNLGEEYQVEWDGYVDVHQTDSFVSLWMRRADIALAG